MGFSFNPGKLAKKAVKGAGNAVKKVAKNPAEVIARATTDVITLGNKRTVDSWTGGAGSNLQGTLSGDPASAFQLAKSAFSAYSNPGAAAQMVGGNVINTFTGGGLQPKPQASGVVDQGYFSTMGGYDTGIKKVPGWVWLAAGSGAIILVIIIAKRK